MHSPFFSIIIPTYNRVHLIVSTLESIRKQTFVDFEVIIVDDGSTDNSSEVIQNYIVKHQLNSNWHYYKKENAERAAARNFGTQKAIGTYVNWFDSDDLAYTNHLENAFEVLQNKIEKIVHFAFDIKLPNGHLLEEKNNFPTHLNELLINGNILSCNNVFVLKSIALLHPFNEDRKLSASEDYELWLRLASHYPILGFNKITSTVVQHDQRSVNNMSSKNVLIDRFTAFIDYSMKNMEVLQFLGSQKKKFLMNNYILLTVELAANSHKSEAKFYLRKAFKSSNKVLFKRSFYATIKHLLLK